MSAINARNYDQLASRFDAKPALRTCIERHGRKAFLFTGLGEGGAGKERRAEHDACGVGEFSHL